MTYICNWSLGIVLICEFFYWKHIFEWALNAFRLFMLFRYSWMWGLWMWKSTTCSFSVLISRHQCDMCLCSSHEYNLNIDYVYFSVEQSISYSCQQCDKQYKYKNNLRRHIRHECNQEPKFCCEICPKRFKQKGHLKSHYLVHMNIDDKKMFMK